MDQALAMIDNIGIPYRNARLRGGPPTAVVDILAACDAQAVLGTAGEQRDWFARWNRPNDGGG